MNKLYITESLSYDPYHNLAVEEYLLENLPSDSVCLYLWHNERTAVIGRNQSAYQEVSVDALEREGGHLARRKSGGGAVYHDLGNLNFTFIMSNEMFDVARENSVIVKALEKLGIKCEVSGRNDLTVDGRKFSGHAYYHGRNNSFHHGTIMLKVDKEAVERYLNVSDRKLSGHSVSSVRSRIINLTEVRKDLREEELKKALQESFEEVYSGVCEEFECNMDVSMYEKNYADRAWIFAGEKDLKCSLEERLEWGSITIRYDLCEGILKDVAVYTDCMDPEVLKGLEERLNGKALNEILLEEAENDRQKDVIRLLLGKENGHEI